MSTQNNAQFPENDTLSFKESTLTDCYSQVKYPSGRLEKCINMSYEMHLLFGEIKHLIQGGYDEIVRGYTPDPKDKSSHVTYNLYTNDALDSGCLHNPSYYIYISWYNRLYSCIDIHEVGEILREYKALFVKIENEKEPTRNKRKTMLKYQS